MKICNDKKIYIRPPFEMAIVPMIDVIEHAAKVNKKSIHMVILRNFKSFDLHTRDQIKVKFMAMFVWYENFSLTVYFSNSPQNGNFTTPQVKGKAEQKREKLIFHQSQNGWMILKIFGAKTIENRCAGGSSLNRLHGQK